MICSFPKPQRNISRIAIKINLQTILVKALQGFKKFCLGLKAKPSICSKDSLLEGFNFERCHQLWPGLSKKASAILLILRQMGISFKLTAWN